jgi:DNA gyrase/topoisomerase IV subunit A
MSTNKLQNRIKISEFFHTDYVDYSSYDNLRKIASLVDGQKNGARKVLHTILEKGIKEKIKVSQLSSKVAEFAEYLHGNLDGVIVNLAQDFSGTNNIPLLQKKGNFGTRFSPDASASRYIHTYGTSEFFKLFSKEDTPVLKHQFFEGNQIEPMFYVPALPILLINGSEGLSTGFAQKILPRSPKKITQYIKDVIKGNLRPSKSNSLEPHYNGFNGTIEQGENHSQWLIKGIVNRVGVNKVQITEVPVGYDLRTYINVLDDLEERKVIQSYADKSEDDNFLFNLTIPSKSLKSWDDETLLTKLKLVKKVTENYTVLDENNKIKVYNSAKEIMDHYIRVKLHYINNRKIHLVNKLNDDIRLDFSRYMFIKMIVDDELVIAKRTKSDIVKDLDLVDAIIHRDGSYDYLLNMNIISLTSERLDKLKADIKLKKSELELLSSKTIEQIWGEEL